MPKALPGINDGKGAKPELFVVATAFLGMDGTNAFPFHTVADTRRAATEDRLKIMVD
jgi:hypothetical protein